MPEPIVILHNVTSPQRVVEFVSICSALNFKHVIISKPGGAAAQMGIPQAFKIAVKNKVFLSILPDIKDVAELYNPEEMLFFVPPESAEKEYDPNILNERKVALVFGGMEPGLSRRETEIGTRVHVGLPSFIGTLGLAAIVLYMSKKTLSASERRE